MQNKPSDITAISYRNPFDDYNANVLTPDLIMRYWYTPFNMGALKNFSETKFFKARMPIVLQGSRGSGKTTILKYFSFPVQCERARQKNISVFNQIVSDSGVGFYLRCDDSFLNMFKTVFKVSVKESWLACFNHYLELFFVKNIVSLLESLQAEKSINVLDLLANVNFKQTDIDTNILTLNDLSQCIDDEIKYINTFKNNALFTDEPFHPQHFFDFYQLSGSLIDVIHKFVPRMDKVNFLLLIDEFENLPQELQKMFNNMVKFCKPGMSLRIGRRSENENIVTKETVNTHEYLREDNDYQLIVLDGLTQDANEWQEYLHGVAAKRLESFDELNISSDISSILGNAEDWNNECSNIAQNSNLHIEYILQGNDTLACNPSLCEQITSIITYPENHIAEALCALWVARTKDKSSYIDSANFASAAMHAFFEKKAHPAKDKFRSDYNNKYKYALTDIIYAAHKKEKLYYSFNTVCYLSEGNTRTFINLCKAIINDALFYERKSFIATGIISEKSQSRAIHDYAMSEFNSVCSIIQDGKLIKNLILQIGNVLSDYHKDRKVRYPETTQFFFSAETLSAQSRKILDIAESWALIKRGKELHRLSASVKEEGYLYTINRIFTPIFNLSYRIRGGVNVTFTANEIDSMINGQTVTKLRKKRGHKCSSTIAPVSLNTTASPAQLSLWEDK